MRVSALRRRLLLLGLAVLLPSSGASSQSQTKGAVKHEAGRCAMRGQCGSESFIYPQLPCPDNGPAEKPDKTTRQKLVDICGEEWSEGAVCCDEDQVDALVKNIKSYPPVQHVRKTSTTCSVPLPALRINRSLSI